MHLKISIISSCGFIQVRILPLDLFLAIAQLVQNLAESGLKHSYSKALNYVTESLVHDKLKIYFKNNTLAETDENLRDALDFEDLNLI